MRIRWAGWIGVGLALLVAGAASAGGYRAPRTRFGAPDLQGVWTNESMTRLFRPSGVTDLVISEAEAARLEAKLTPMRTHPTDDDLGQTESEWRTAGKLARLQGQVRTSWIVSPANGRLPFNAAGRAAMEHWLGDLPADGPEQRPGSDRCLMTPWGAAGPPMLNAPYANNYHILQTRTEVLIEAEANHETRIVELGGPPPPAGQRRWMGWSVGHWEGDTLVVETRGFRTDEIFRQPMYVMSPDAKVTERFTRVGPRELKYEFTVDDPAYYAAVWRGEMPFTPATSPSYEYACHEGNYSMANMLAGARHDEAEAASSKAR